MSTLATSKEFIMKGKPWLSDSFSKMCARVQVGVLDCDIVLARMQRLLTVGCFTKRMKPMCEVLNALRSN